MVKVPFDGDDEGPLTVNGMVKLWRQIKAA